MSVMRAASPDQARMGVVFDHRLQGHDTGPGHPEQPERLRVVEQALRQRGLLQRCRRIDARPITDAELLRCHTQRYLNTVRRDVAYGRGQLSTGDTAISDDSEDVARLAAGGALAAVDAVLQGVVDRAFALVRPPGHHAEANRGMGFCLFNNIALAARHAQAAHGIERLLILDWDVHHGNGTEAILGADPSVLLVGVHERGNYPGSGESSTASTINIPLPSGSDGPALLQALEHTLLPAAARFQPQLVLISAGFDGHADDPLAGFQLQATDYGALTQLALAVAREHADGRLVSALEGGYNLPALASSCCAHVDALLTA